MHPEAQGIWDMMTAEELLTFRFNAGGEVNQRIAWSRVSRRFFYVYYSNPSMIFVKVIFFTSPLLS